MSANNPSAATPTTEAAMDTETQRVDVLAVMDELVNYLWNPFEPDNQDEKYKRAVKARSAVAEQQNILHRLVAWNHNVNGDGAELAELLALAEALVGRGGATGERRHGVERIPAVAELIEALRNIRDYEGHASTPVRNSVKKSGIARAALARIGAKP